MIYVPEATMYHAHRLTFRTFCRQHFNYGRGALLLQKIRRQQGWQLFKPDPRYYARLLRSSLYAGPIARVVSLWHCWSRHKQRPHSEWQPSGSIRSAGDSGSATIFFYHSAQPIIAPRSWPPVCVPLPKSITHVIASKSSWSTMAAQFPQSGSFLTFETKPTSR